ncbi:MAG: hypothetical protein LJE59_09425 [Chromatiaceae bacterium]|nr:hypothetical protein [Chromatiaceae bacterium]
MAETHGLNGQVLVVRGDGHYFKMHKAMFADHGRLTASFTRVGIFGNADTS